MASVSLLKENYHGFLAESAEIQWILLFKAVFTILGAVALIRKLKASGMTYRQIAHIARCSAGAVGAEMRALKKEKAMEEKIKQELEEATAKITLDHRPNPELLPDANFNDCALILLMCF